ncbi:MAG: class III signal peptide-containing protein [Methanomicrobiales archaeon]
MGIFNEEKAQGSAEMILLFGGIIVIAIVAAVYYRNYLSGLGNEINSTDVENVTNSISNLKDLF